MRNQSEYYIWIHNFISNPEVYLLGTTLDAIGTFDKNPASQSWIGGMKLRSLKYFLGKGITDQMLFTVLGNIQKEWDTETEKCIYFFSRKMRFSSKQIERK